MSAGRGPEAILRRLVFDQGRSLAHITMDGLAATQSRVERGRPDCTISNSREYLLTGIANAVPKTTRQRAGRQAETVVGVGPPGPANATTTILPLGPAIHSTVLGLPPGEDVWRFETARPSTPWRM